MNTHIYPLPSFFFIEHIQLILNFYRLSRSHTITLTFYIFSRSNTITLYVLSSSSNTYNYPLLPFFFIEHIQLPFTFYLLHWTHFPFSSSNTYNYLLLCILHIQKCIYTYRLLCFFHIKHIHILLPFTLFIIHRTYTLTRYVLSSSSNTYHYPLLPFFFIEHIQLPFTFYLLH